MAVIKLKRSDTPGNTPNTLEHGEVAINIPDKKIYIGSGDTNDTAVLIVDGNAIGGSTSTETIQDAAASLFTSGTHVGISVSYPDTNNAINLRNTGVLSFNSRTGSVSLTSSDVTTALGYTPQRQEPTLTAIANLSPDADDLIYFSGTDGAAITTLTSFGRSLIDDLNASAARTTLGLAIGTNVQAWDADLDAIAALSGTSGVLKKTATNTWSLDTAIATLTGVETLTNKTLTSPTISNLYLSDGLILVEGTTNDSNEMSLVVGMLTADRTITFPNATGTVITTGNLTSITTVGTLGGASISGILSVNTISVYSGTNLLINDDGNVRTVIGDLTGNGNSTYIDIDDASGSVYLNTSTATISGSLSLGAGVTITSPVATTTTSTSIQTIYSESADAYRSIQFYVQAQDTTGLKYETLEIKVIHDGTNTYNTQYGLIRTSTTLGTYTTTLVTLGGGEKILRLRVTPASTNSTTFTVYATALPA